MQPGQREIDVRRALPADAGAVGDLVRAAYRHYVPRIGREPVPMTLDYAAVVAAGDTWVARDGDRLVGVLVLEDAEDHLLVENLAVLPEAQGLGVGRRLLRYAEDSARARGLPEVRLYTHELMTENRAYYPRRGYVETHVSGDPPWRRAFFSKRLDP